MMSAEGRKEADEDDDQLGLELRPALTAFFDEELIRFLRRTKPDQEHRQVHQVNP
jgi:hypothetical protein